MSEWPLCIANYYSSIPGFPFITIWDVDDFMSNDDIPIRWRELGSGITRNRSGYSMEFRSQDEYTEFVLRWS